MVFAHTTTNNNCNHHHYHYHHHTAGVLRSVASARQRVAGQRRFAAGWSGAASRPWRHHECAVLCYAVLCVCVCVCLRARAIRAVPPRRMCADTV